MLFTTKTAALLGIEGVAVNTEIDAGRGLPTFHVTGLGDMAVKEAADRVRSAILNCGFSCSNNGKYSFRIRLRK